MVQGCKELKIRYKNYLFPQIVHIVLYINQRGQKVNLFSSKVTRTLVKLCKINKSLRFQTFLVRIRKDDEQSDAIFQCQIKKVLPFRYQNM